MLYVTLCSAMLLQGKGSRTEVLPESREQEGSASPKRDLLVACMTIEQEGGSSEEMLVNVSCATLAHNLLDWQLDQHVASMLSCSLSKVEVISGYSGG
jgi:hypothetical protein